MKKNPLVIINNEKVFKQGSELYCDNLDMKVLPEGLSIQHDVEFIVRSSKIKGSQPLNLKNIKIASNIFKFIYFIINTFKKKKVSYLLITITPYTFISFLILFLSNHFLSPLGTINTTFGKYLTISFIEKTSK